MSTDLKFSLFTTIVVSCSDCCRWFNRCTALIQAEGELSPSLAAIVTSPAKIFCQNVNFSFFVIDVMLLTS
jgi:antirestriction protein